MSLHLHHLGPDDPVEQDRERARAVISALRRAARDGDVSINLTLNSVTFEWPHLGDPLFVYVAIMGKQP